MKIEVMKPGLLTTIQDQGRFGYQDIGVQVSGFMDEFSAHLANILVGNSAESALLEMTLLGATLRFHGRAQIALTGADCRSKLDGQRILNNHVMNVKQGDILEVGHAQKGLRTYLAISGEFDIPEVYGSLSTNLEAGFGGLNGRVLEKNDLINYIPRNNPASNSGDSIDFDLSTDVIEVLPGPEFDSIPEHVRKWFFETKFTVSNDSNRTGIRLSNNQMIPSELPSILSSGLVKGTVQIPNSGNPIVLMADAPTTGGYPRIAACTDMACNQLAQMKLGDSFKFTLKN